MRFLIFSLLLTITSCKTPEINDLNLRVNNDKAGAITAELNDFIDKLFINIQTFAVKNGLDPTPLGNISESFLGAEIDLTNGAIHGISTIQRYEDVLVSYQSKRKTISVTFPVKFSNLSFTYDYHVTFLHLGPKGYLIGEIENFKFHLELEFSFLTYAATIKELKTTDSGHISLTFHGNIIDAIIDIVSQFITTILHPILQGIIEGIIKSVARKVVENINDFIYNITHPDDLSNFGYKYPQYFINYS